jgi:prepilin peptidase CpaA
MTIPHVAAIVVAALGCVTDLRTRRIPNVLTFGAAAGAFGFYLFGGGWSGLGWSVGGWAVGLAVFLPLFVLRGLGGGDVKLLAALGAWLGPGTTIWLALWSAVAGGPLAVVVALSRGYLRTAFSNLWSLLTFWRIAGVRPHPAVNLETSGSPRLPYALPIAAGLMVTLWLH